MGRGSRGWREAEGGGLMAVWIADVSRVVVWGEISTGNFPGNLPLLSGIKFRKSALLQEETYGTANQHRY